MVNMRLAVIGKRPKLTFPEPSRRRARRAGARSRLFTSPTPQAGALPGLSTARARRRRAHRRARRSIQEHGTTTVLFDRRRAAASPTRASSIITVGAGMRMKLDPVTLEVIRNALPAVANEMAADLQRTSYNMMIYEVRDYLHRAARHQGRS